MKPILVKIIPVFLLSFFYAPILLAAEAPSKVADVDDISTARGVFHGPVTNTVDVADIEHRLVEAWERGKSKDAVPLEDTTFPISHYPNGNVRAQLGAKHAFLPPSDDPFVFGHGVVVEMFSEKGLFDGVFKTDHCVYDRSSRSGYCVGSVEILYRNVEITGTNMIWHVVNRNARILSHSKVVLNRFSEGMKGVFKR